ncbi:unnamed protein product [Schistosoma curassoni]|uniref:Dynein_AAA_lid domain-containing protein n=1 Tax=Schistosoma curassoni TaxID=6186 RepID=A0A183KC44_9TREM|nr:unnamed protein product [Schistosoma curassoni]
MNFSEILRNLLFPPHPPTNSSIHNTELHKTSIYNNDNTNHINNKLCLLLSHGNAVHELFFIECINQFLQNYATTIIHQSPIPTTMNIIDDDDNNNSTVPDDQQNTTKCLIFCFHKSWNIYHKLINPLYANNITLKNNLTIIDMTVMLENLLLKSNSYAELDNNDKDLITDENIGTIIKNYIKDKTDEFLKNNYTTNPSNGVQQKNIGIFIDNITALYDLGVTVRELEQFLCSWLYHSRDQQTVINIANILVCIGIHIGDFFQDSIVSEYEPALPNRNIEETCTGRTYANVLINCSPKRQWEDPYSQYKNELMSLHEIMFIPHQTECYPLILNNSLLEIKLKG